MRKKLSGFFFVCFFVLVTCTKLKEPDWRLCFRLYRYYVLSTFVETCWFDLGCENTKFLKVSRKLFTGFNHFLWHVTTTESTKVGHWPLQHEKLQHSSLLLFFPLLLKKKKKNLYWQQNNLTCCFSRACYYEGLIVRTWQKSLPSGVLDAPIKIFSFQGHFTTLALKNKCLVDSSSLKKCTRSAQLHGKDSP